MENSETADSSIFTAEELDVLKFTKGIRMAAIKEMVKDGPSDNTSVNRVVNELATSLDKSVTDSANTRLKHQDNNNKGAMIATIAETLKQVTRNSNKPRNVVIDLPTELEIDDDVVGELEISPVKLEIEDFINKEI